MAAQLTDMQLGSGEDSKQDHEALMQAVLTVLRGIKATGFKDIEDEMITTSNTYSIKPLLIMTIKGTWCARQRFRCNYSTPVMR